MQRVQFSAAIVLITLFSGCATSSLRDSWSRTIATLPGTRTSSQSVLTSDWVRTELSDEFRTAQKSLKNPEAMLMVHAQLLEDQHNYAEARQRYRELITAYPNSVQAGLGLARIEHQTGREQQAELILTALQQTFPKDVSVRLAFGQQHTDRDQHGAAVQSFAMAVELDPENQEARYQLGLALAKTQRYEEALEHLSFAVGESAATYNVGYLLYENGQTSEALRWFNAALDAHPDSKTRSQASRMIAQLSHRDVPDDGQFDVQLASQADTIRRSQIPFRTVGATTSTPQVRPATPRSSPATGTATRSQSNRTFERPSPTNATNAVNPRSTSATSGNPPPWQGPGVVRPASSAQILSATADSGQLQQPPAWRSHKK
jgi:tetratricopeptide (TPR) repeat protein